MQVLYALLAFAGGQKPDGDLSIAKAADKLLLVSEHPEFLRLRPGKYSFNSSMMPTTPQVTATFMIWCL